MSNLKEIRAQVAEMAALTLSMWQRTFTAFMEHDLDVISRVLEDEHKLNDWKKRLLPSL